MARETPVERVVEARRSEEEALVRAETDHEVEVMAHVEVRYAEVQWGVKKRKSDRG